MAKILAIETATRVCSIALISDREVQRESTVTVPHAHVEKLMTMINELLAGLNLRHRDIDAIAVSNGPGSFTGLRIGLSVAKGISYSIGTKLIAVPTLDAIAFGTRNADGGRTVVPVLHARGDEFYYSSYKFVNSNLEKLGDHKIADAETIALESGPGTLFVGEGAGELSKSAAVSAKFGKEAFRDQPASAADVGLLAGDKYDRNEFAELSSLVPTYIKDFVAVKGNPLNKLLEKS